MVDSAMRTIHHDVAIIGGGLVGTWTAYFLRKRGRSVAVIEKGAVGSQASGVNFGNVRLQGRHPSEFPLALRAMEQWERIEKLIGERCEFSQCGHYYIALDPIETKKLDRYRAEGMAAGLDIELLGGNELRRRFPWLGPDACGAIWSKRDGTANPRLVTPAVARAARALGAEIFPNTRVLGLDAIGESLRVATDRDIAFEAPFVLNAAGAWGNEIARAFGETAPMFEAAPPAFSSAPGLATPSPRCSMKARPKFRSMRLRSTGSASFSPTKSGSPASLMRRSPPRQCAATRRLRGHEPQRTQAHLLWRSDRHPDARQQVRASGC